MMFCFFLSFSVSDPEFCKSQGTEEEEKEGLLCQHPLFQFLMALCCEYEAIFTEFFFSQASKNVESATGQPVEAESEAAA